jgi:hypothetical protein
MKKVEWARIQDQCEKPAWLLTIGMPFSSMICSLLVSKLVNARVLILPLLMGIIAAKFYTKFGLQSVEITCDNCKSSELLTFLF